MEMLAKRCRQSNERKKRLQNIPTIIVNVLQILYEYQIHPEPKNK